jgi:hypothetical protein
MNVKVFSNEDDIKECKNIKIRKAKIRAYDSFGKWVKEVARRGFDFLGKEENYYMFVPGYYVKDIDVDCGISRKEADKGNLVIGDDCVIFITDEKIYILKDERN